MSRCFPFPPPGYEKKPRLDDLSVLKEEKQKEKKQKKEKKDKEKREGKEKRDKEKNDVKHRDKKDRKDKHKDKKDKRREKKKEKSKDRDKSSTSETSKITGLPECDGAEKLNPEDGKDNSYSVEEKNHTAQSYGQNGDGTVQSNFVARKTEESKFVQELDRRIRVEEKITGSELADKISGLDQKRDDEALRFAARNPGNLAEEKGKSREKQFYIKEMDGQGIFSGKPMVHNHSGNTKGKVEGIPKLVETNDERRLGEKEKTKERDDKRGEKHKDKNRDKKTYGKGKDGEKERKKEKVKVKSEEKKGDQDKLKDVSRSILIGAVDSKSASVSLDLHNNVNIEGNLKKRKGVDINGFLHDTEARPNKMQRPTSHQVVENGRKLEACQVPGLLASDRQGVATILKVDEKEGRKNGMVESPPLPVTKPKSSATADVNQIAGVSRKPPHPDSKYADQIAEVSRKPPHPDSEYLNQILSIPKMDEWPEFDEQEWLFTGQDPSVRKGGAGEELQVWSEAKHLESADVVALPYVIPY